MARIYLDSNVFISFVKEEIDPHFRGLFAEAQNFFIKAKLNGYVLVLSELFLFETEKRAHFDKKWVSIELDKIGVAYEWFTSPTNSAPIEISAMIHFPDSLHVVLALESRSEYIVTFNIKDFLPANRWIKVIKPDEI